MQAAAIVIFWACVLTFAASWLFAMVNWVLLVGERRNAVKDLPDAFKISTDMPGSSDAVVYARRFMRGLTAGIIALTTGAAVGIGSGILH